MPEVGSASGMQLVAFGFLCALAIWCAELRAADDSGNDVYELGGGTFIHCTLAQAWCYRVGWVLTKAL